MADTMQFDFVSPERRITSLSATEVQIPGAEGDMTAMPGHAPTITTLRPGVLRVVHAGGTEEFLVSGGFAEVSAETVSVLAEEGHARAEISHAVLDRLVTAARATHAESQTDTDAKIVADLLAAGEFFGLTKGQ